MIPQLKALGHADVEDASSGHVQGERDRVAQRPVGRRRRSAQRRARLSANEAAANLARQLERFDNLVSLFLTRAAEKGDAPFLWAKREGEWRSISWSEAARQVAALAASLKRIGLQPGDRVALVSENRPEWLIADLAIMAAGCVTVPTYTTNTDARSCAYARQFGRAGGDRLEPEARQEPRFPRCSPRANATMSSPSRRCARARRRTGSTCHRWPKLAAGEADVAALREARRSDRPRRPRLHHLHQRHRRGAARRAAAPRRDPRTISKAAPTSSRPISAGTTRCSCPSSRQPCLRAYRRAAFPDRAWRADLLRREPRKARRQHRGSAADDHGRRSAAVRDASRADHQVDRDAVAACQNICSIAR